jgi:hypothetical protein
MNDPLDPLRLDHARDFARRLGATRPVEVQYARAPRGTCQDVLATMRPHMRVTSGMDMKAPCYLVLMFGHSRLSAPRKKRVERPP